jgi:hypothetical protein
MTRSHLRVVVLMCVLVGGAVAPFAVPATAQAGANNSSNATGANNSSGSGTPTGLTGSNVSSLRPAQVNRSGNATNATNGSNGSGGGGGVVSDVTGAAEGAWNSATPNVPSTEQIANDTATWVKNKSLNATQFFLKKSMTFIVGTVHPENSGPNGIFGTPTNQPYKNLYQAVYGPISFQYSILILIILLLALVIVMPYAGLASGGTYRVTQACARICTALLLIMFWWPIGTALMQFFDAIAMSIAPSPEELTTSMQGLFKLSVGPLLAVLAVILIDLAEILSLALVYAFRQGALIVSQFAMPLLLVFAYAGPHRRVRSMASTIAWQYFALLTMTIPAAFFMRIGFEAKWGFGFGPFGNAILSMMLLGLALGTPFVFSIAAFRAPPAINSLASGAAGAAIGAGSTAKNRVTSDEEGEEEDDDSGVEQQTVYVEGQSAQDRVAATDGGTNYTNATARGSGPTAGALGDGSSSPTGTAERIRDFERQSNGQNGGSATAKTRHYNNQRDVIDVESTVINEEDSS